MKRHISAAVTRVLMCAAVVPIPAVAAEIMPAGEPVMTDTVAADPAAHHSVVGKVKSLAGKVIDYFGNSNKHRSGGAMDFSVIGGPYYTSDMGLGLGIVASGIYGHGVDDDVTPPSNVSLFGKVSTKGFGSLGIRGTHISRSEAQRFNYRLEVLCDPSDFWGIGYEMDNNDANESRMRRIGVQLRGEALFKVLPDFYVGPVLSYDFVKAHDIERPELLDGERTTTWAGGAGVTLSYDTRDVLTYPHRGVYVTVSQMFYPKFVGNHYAFSSTSIQADWYHSVWKGGVVALDFRSELNYGSPSWYMLASVGGSYYLRGYYEGRYRDKGMMSFQAELRQRVWRRSGAVLWAGAGSVFARPSEIMMRRMLPNVGVGYRWEFKKDVNVRLDVGMGKSGQWGFIFNINEAF